MANEIRRHSKNQTVTITNATTTSTAVDGRDHSLYGLVMPAAFTGTSITFQVSHDDVTFQALYDINNVQVSLSVAAARSYDLPTELASWAYWKIVSGSAEGADRNLVVMAKG